MIVVTDGKAKILHCRTNRRVKWQYADYGGRYVSNEAAIESAKEHYGSQPFEYHVEDMDTKEVVTGFVNWNR